MTSDERELGGSYALGAWRVRRVGYGAMQQSGDGVFGPPRDRGEALRVLRAVVDAGVNHIDTAQFYGAGTVNALIREALHPYPSGLAIVSKVGGSSEPGELRRGIEDNLRIGRHQAGCGESAHDGPVRESGRCGRRAGPRASRRARAWSGRAYPAATLERLPHRRVGSEGSGPLAENQVVAHAAGGRGPDAVKESLWTARVSSRSAARPGARLELAVDTSRLHFFDPSTGESIGLRAPDPSRRADA